MHYHFRDGVSLQHTVPAVARLFARAIAMPNLKPPVVNAEMALAYYQRIKDCVPEDCEPFEPLMTLYLTDQTTPEMIADAKATGLIVACKLYPAGATTNSDSGVTDLDNIGPALEKMWILEKCVNHDCCLIKYRNRCHETRTDSGSRPESVRKSRGSWPGFCATHMCVQTHLSNLEKLMSLSF